MHQTVPNTIRRARTFVRAHGVTPYLNSGIIARLPATLLTALYWFATTRTGDQIAELFATTATFRPRLLLVAIALASTACLLVLVSRRNFGWAVVDGVLLVLPPVLLLNAFLNLSDVLFLIVLLLAAAAGAAALRATRMAARVPLLPGAVAAMAIAVWSALHVVILASPVDVPRQMGSLVIVFAFAGLSAVMVQIALRYGQMGLLVLAALLVLFLRHEETSHIQQVDVLTEERTALAPDEWLELPYYRANVSLQEAFHTWLASRNDLEDYISIGEPYPVFVVTAEGGGGLAAAHVDLFLTKMQQRCPNFAQHIFAIVGVSGGAVGSSLFRAGLPEITNIDGFAGCDREVDSGPTLVALGDDHLAPVVAALLFQDVPNKTLFGLFGDFDRAEALVRSLTDGLAETSRDPNPLHWDHFWEDGGNAPRLGESPALIHVATNVVSGKRYVFAPFTFRWNGMNGRFEESIIDLNWTGPDEYGPRSSDIFLFDAAVASASFPWITPSRAIGGRLQEVVALVDGGYLDNGGAETAAEIVAELMTPNCYFDGAVIVGIMAPRSFVGSGNVDGCALQPQYAPAIGGSELDAGTLAYSVRAIVIRSEVPYGRGAQEQSFLFDPVRAILNARSRRAETARFGLLQLLCRPSLEDPFALPTGGGLDCPPQVEFARDWGLLESVIGRAQLELPLGWNIPAGRLTAMDTVVAPAPTEVFCYAMPDIGMAAIFARQSSDFGTMNNNPETVRAIVAALTPGGNEPPGPVSDDCTIPLEEVR